MRTPVDAFILARLEQKGLTPAPLADRGVLLRRVTLDLTGLPPKPEEVEAFLRDTRPDAYARVVEGLLASPHYGERWARHWMDVVGYAESNGYEADAERPHAWRYRDYLVRSFNEDKPYDRFVTEQLAGDLLLSSLIPHPSSLAFADLLVATGFNRCGPVHVVSGNTNPEVNRQEQLTEMTGAVGSAFLGLTIGCARCHDHKFDPITQAEYYQMQAFFAAARPEDVAIATAEEESRSKRQAEDLQKKIAPLRQRVAELEAPYKSLLTELKKASLEPAYRAALDVPAAKRTAEQKKQAEHAAILIKVTWDELLEAMTPEERARRAQWRSQIHALEAQMPPPAARAWAVREDKKTPQTYILKRGDPKRKGREVQPGFPAVLTAAREEDPGHRAPSPSHRARRGSPDPAETPARRGSPDPADTPDRLALARWLTQPDHPLTARVLVNRLWQHHFGRGLVATPNDFGLHGEAPTHPELLDWLAREFVRGGWSIKHLHRLMVLSSTYQQASRLPEEAPARRIDPDNRLLARMNRQRLEGEALRDSALAVSGRLNPKLGGPMVRVPLEPEVYELIFTEGEPDGLWHVSPDPREHTRRSIYLFAKRNVRLPLFEAFDQPDSLSSCPVRPVSTFAPQALILLNGPFMQHESQALAARLWRECGPEADRQVRRAYGLALGRSSREVELCTAREFLDRQADLIRDRLRNRQPVRLPPGLPIGADPAAAAALADFCLALFNRNEFLYVD